LGDKTTHWVDEVARALKHKNNYSNQRNKGEICATRENCELCRPSTKVIFAENQQSPN
jgi:hypothetical protein